MRMTEPLPANPVDVELREALILLDFYMKRGPLSATDVHVAGLTEELNGLASRTAPPRTTSEVALLLTAYEQIDERTTTAPRVPFGDAWDRFSGDERLLADAAQSVTEGHAIPTTLEPGAATIQKVEPEALRTSLLAASAQTAHVHFERERRLGREYRAFLQDAGHVVVAHRYLVPGLTRALQSVLFDETANTLTHARAASPAQACTPPSGSSPTTHAWSPARLRRPSSSLASPSPASSERSTPPVWSPCGAMRQGSLAPTVVRFAEHRSPRHTRPRPRSGLTTNPRHACAGFRIPSVPNSGCYSRGDSAGVAARGADTGCRGDRLDGAGKAEEMAMAGPLSGIRVIEIALAGVGPWSCTLLSEMGAEIIKVGEGDIERGPAPSKNGASSMYLASNLGKRVAQFDLHDEIVRETMYELVRQSDVLIENHRPGYLDRRGLSYEAVAKINPRMIYCSSSGYGSYGPYAQMGSSDSYGQAIGGFASVSGPVGGIAEGMKGTSPLDHAASQNIVVGVLAALYNREFTGRGQYIDTSQMHAAVGISGPRAAEYFASGVSPVPMGTGVATIVPSRAYKAADGKWLNLSALDEPTWQRLCSALGLPGLATDRRLQTNAGRVANRAEVDAAIESAIASQPVEHWIAALLAAKVPAGAYLTFNNLRVNQQVRQHAMIEDVESPWGRITVGGMPWKFSRTPGEIRPPSRAGSANEEVMTRFAPPETPPSPAVAPPPIPRTRGPLEGLQVVDLTQGYAGYCGMIMGDLGATVVKVEPPTGDYLRLQGPPFLGETAAAFIGVNRSKQSIQLAWETDASSRAALDRLIDRADILITDLQPIAAKEKGLDHQSLAATHSRLVHLSITPFGDSGPMADQPATDLEIQGISGDWQWLGEPGGEPVRMGIPIGPIYAAIFGVHGALAAMHERTKSGKGQLVSVSQLGSQLTMQSTIWVSESEPDEWAGHCMLRFGPPAQGYPTQDTRILWGLGREEEAWRTFYNHIGIKEMRQRGGIDTGIDPVVAEAMADFPAEQLIEWVRELGGSAVPVHTFETLQQDPQARALGLVSEYEYPGVGKVGTTGVAWEFSETPAKHGRPPLLGEHTGEVLRTLGLQDAERAAIERAATGS